MSITQVVSNTQSQTLHFAVSATSHLGIEPELKLTQLELRGTKIDLRLAYQDVLEFGLRMRQTTSFGPVGNITLEGQADIASNGKYQLSLSADGVIGSVAANLDGHIFNTLPGTFNLSEAFETTRPHFAQGSSLGMGLSYRLSRNQVLSAYPSLYFLQEGFAATLEADFKIYKFFEPHDVSFLLQAYLSPSGKTYTALGFQFDLNEKNLPSMAASAWLSLGSQGLLPGLRASLSQSFKSTNSKLGVSLGLEPYRSDFIPYYLQASYTQAFDFGTLEANLYTALGTETVAPLTLKIGYAYKF